MYVRQARPLGCRGWEAARRRWRRMKRMETVESAEEGGRGRCRGGVERAPAYTLRIIYWHWIYLKLCYTEAAIVLLRPTRLFLSFPPSLLPSYYDRVDFSLALFFSLSPLPSRLSLSLTSSSSSSSLALSLLIPTVSFSFLRLYALRLADWPP